MKPLDEFKRDVPAYLPGMLVLFDLADAKRRNNHLGHLVVDDDIAEFDRLIQTSVGASGLAKRVAGDKWLAIYQVGSLESVKALLIAYYRDQECLIGWRAAGQKEGVTKVVERTVRARIIRALRCLYSVATYSPDVNGLIEQLFEHNYSLPPNTPLSLSEAINTKKKPWACVTAYPSENPFCPFCEGRDFDWDDGDDSVYSGSGTCQNCGAEVDIRGIEHVA